MSKASDAGKLFLAGVFAKLSDADRTQAQAIFEKAEHEGALEVIGTGALAQPDINRRYDELKVKETELDTLTDQNQAWWAEHQAAIADYLKIKPEYDKLKGNPNPNPNPQPVAGLTREDIAADLEQRDRAFAGALALGVTLSTRHLQMFNEVLDVNALLTDARLGQPIKNQPGRVFGLQDAYTAAHGERVATKAKEAEDARINKLVEEKLAEERKKQPALQPYPLGHGPDPSPLDVLQTKDGIAQHTVDSAVAFYDRLQADRAGAGA